ncbi:unnamed protein product [Periconia digitata]|uniref:Membrane insertase YidC/Oxa/ALB C-terminal domain-containing protein n=1 Tax=Periconia digitata TaxID=1303443 RepID=A0A9W4U493_9PLEO|nr:unnamed protein product [Periconia digitata]
MIPNRGLRPHQFSAAALRHPSVMRSGASRQISSLPRSKSLSTLPGRTSPLRATNWRAGTPLRSNLRLSTSSVRYGSWYAPWTWGGSSQPDNTFAEAHSPVATTPSSPTPADFVAKSPEPVVTSSTPELAPAGIDKAAVVEPESAPKIIEDVLAPDSTPGDVPFVDPTQIISYWGNMKDLGLDYGWGSSAFFQNLVELSYLNTDLGWTGSIAVSALILRMILFWGFQRGGSDSMAKMAAMKPMLQPLLEETEEAKRLGDDERVHALKLKQQTILKDVGTEVYKNVAPAVAQMVFGFGAFRCLNGMAHLPVPGMSSESLLWINDLTISDPYYILPVVTGGIMYTVIKAGGETGVNNSATVSSMQKNIQVVMPVVMTCITAFQPAALQFYFLVSSTLGGVTGWALKQPSFRRVLRIRQLPSPESNKIYSRVAKGEISLEGLRGPDGKIRYRAPNSTSSSTSSSSSRTNSRTNSRASKRRFTTSQNSSSANSPLAVQATLKPGVVLPPHMARPTRLSPQNKELMDRDIDYEDGMPEGLGEKWDYVKRNYKPSFIAKRTWRAMSGDSRDIAVIAEHKRKEKAKAAAERYEVERKRRFEGR